MSSPRVFHPHLGPDEKRALLAHLVGGGDTRDGRMYPLSFAQQRLWFLDRLAPHTASYNVDTALRLRMPIDAGALEQSLNEIVRRHGSLRTSFDSIEGRPLQVVAPTARVPLACRDLAGLPEEERDAEVVRLATASAKQPFDLAAGPLIRAELIRLGPSEYVFVVTMHHIVADGWSLEVFFRELSALYAAFSSGRSSPLPELPIQYVDFAVWQRKWLQGEMRERQLEYWKSRLAGLQPLELSTDFPRPPVQTFAGAYHAVVLPERVTSALRQFGRDEDATLFMVLLATFQTLLHRYTGQDDIAVGSVIAGRNRVETEPLIGFFANTVVLRTQVSGTLTFREVLARVREVALGAYAHQELPFEMLVEHMQSGRDLSHTPLFQVGFSLQNRLGRERELLRRSSAEDPTVVAMMLDTGSAKFDLTLLCEEADETITLLFEYRTDLFESPSIQRMAEHYTTLLQSILVDPGRRISHLPLLSAAERHQILVEWNPATATPPLFACVHHIVETQARNTPEAVAAVVGPGRLTYRELNERANQLARHIRSRGVRTETPVGVFMHRSLDMVVAVVAIMKAGGAFLPLEPVHPDERLRFVITDAGAGLVLTHGLLRERLDLAHPPVVSVDAEREAIARESTIDLELPLSAENLAYVIYTSGSTGRPKGVLVQHGGASNVGDAQRQLLGIRADDRVLQFASPSFDAWMCEFLMAMGAGAELHLGDIASLLPGSPLQRFLREHSITVVLLQPSALASLDPAMLPDLRLVTVCGEPFSSDLVDRWSPGRRFFNLYGPTESTIFVTVAECAAGARRPDIGRPIPRMEAFVLDRHRQPVPIGVAGELYVGGIGLARGYVNLQELTDERFVAHPLRARGARVYRTGDLVRYLPDGRLDFLGRVDDQVKIRGFRIEPGEIVSALLEHSAVQDAAVIVREDRPGEKRLVAYVVPRTGRAPSATELRGGLKQRLPEYMAPNAFVTLAALPLTTSGKIDRAALPRPETARPELEDEYVAPRTDLEHAIGALWQQVLDLDRVGVDDNFFDLGGHSLLMVRLQARLQDVLGLQVSIVELFQYPTVAALAAFVSEKDAAPVETAGALQRAERWRQAIGRRARTR
jgi:amino acid adenylation domain-containing protein